jgi:hypothetical protein
MRLLHSLRPVIDQPIAWYGAAFRCRDSYHNGYENERTNRTDHYECATRTFGRDQTLVSVPYICDCLHCRTIYSRTAHYFALRAGDYNPNNHTAAENTARNGTPDYIFICDHCAAGTHPTPGVAIP